MTEPDPTRQEVAAPLQPHEIATLANRLTNEQLIELLKAHQNSDEVLSLVNRSRNEAMVALMNSHNPYTTNDPKDMSVFVGNPDPANSARNNIRQIELEVDGPYTMPMEWNFKGSPQKINKTLRLKYRYRARNLDHPDRPLLEPRHWVTAYLLIGFEDGGF